MIRWGVLPAEARTRSTQSTHSTHTHPATAQPTQPPHPPHARTDPRRRSAPASASAQTLLLRSCCAPPCPSLSALDTHHQVRPDSAIINVYSEGDCIPPHSARFSMIDK